jgi:inosose dehydratase
VGIKIGTAPVSWGIMEVEGWNGQAAYGKVLDEMVEAGYQGTELGPYGYMPTDPIALITELSSRGLQMVSAFVPIPLSARQYHGEALEEAMKVAELLAAVGARLIVLAGDMNTSRMAVAGRVVEERDGLSDRAWHDAVEIITRIARACSQVGLATAFHHHAGTFVETPNEIERLCASTDPSLVGLCLDTGHYVYGGGDPVEAVDKYGARIRHLHFKDVRPAVLESIRQERVGFLDAVRRGVFCELGEGAVDFPEISRRLISCGFEGWAVVEQDVDAGQPGVKPLESAVRSRRYLRETIEL